MFPRCGPLQQEQGGKHRRTGEKRNGQRDQKRLAERRIFYGRQFAGKNHSNCNKEQNNTSRDAYGRLIQTEELHDVITKKQKRERHNICQQDSAYQNNTAPFWRDHA